MRTPLLLLMLATAIAGYGQATRTLYFDTNGQVTTADKASTYAVITRHQPDTTLYAVQTFAINKRPLAEGDYRARTFPVAWEKLLSPDFREAFRQGTHRHYHPNGQRMFQGDFLDGKGKGLHQRWYESGRLLSESRLVNGQDEGPATDYYPNGNPQLQLNYQQGLPDGELTEYYENGRKKARTTMKKGKKGKLTRFDDREQPLPEQ